MRRRPKQIKKHEEVDKDELAEVRCPNCDHPLSEPINDIWKDPQVKEALKEGRPADDIAVLDCPECGRWGYYNQGSHFSCRFCDKTWSVLCEGEEPTEGVPHLFADSFISLADTVTETTEGYDNRTL